MKCSLADFLFCRDIDSFKNVARLLQLFLRNFIMKKRIAIFCDGTWNRSDAK